MLHTQERSRTNKMSDEKWKDAAQVGDINLLYKLIQEDPHALELMDAIPFVDTPLHVAASAGHLQFATEIMRLKPSFAWKLNQQGLSPIHLAIQEGHQTMVHRFVDINQDLVRVKGREGLTPLHLVSQTGHVDLLANFLSACPQSVEDVTVRSETALHIAVRNKRYEVLRVLLGWLKRNRYAGATDLEKTILNWKDEEGNTILHISALLNDSLALRLLMKSKMDLKAKNLEKSTAFDIAASAEIKIILSRAGARGGSKVTDAPTLADKLKSKITFMDKIIIDLLRMRGDTSEDKRNAYLVVAALIATATYQSALSPPGGVTQANSGGSTKSAPAAAPSQDAGKSVMSDTNFLIISFLNGLSLLVTTLAIFILTPSGRVGRVLFLPMFFFAYCYLYSMVVISPSEPETRGVAYSLLVVFFILCCVVYLTYVIAYKTLERYGQKKEIESRNSKGGNIW